MVNKCSFISMPTKACIRLQDKQQDHHCSQHSGMVQRTTFLPELNAVLPFFNSSTSHCLSKPKKKKTPVWQNHREIQGHKHAIHNPENLFSELEAPKGWILQGNLLRVLDVPKNKVDRAEKPLRFSVNCWTTEPSTTEDGTSEHYWTHLDFIGASAASPSPPVSHSCSSAQHFHDHHRPRAISLGGLSRVHSLWLSSLLQQ